MDALQAMEEAAEQAAAAAAEGRDGSYGESMGLRPSCRRTRSARNPAGALPGGAMLGGWSAFREMSGLLPFAPSARFAAPSMGFLDLPWMGEIGGEGGHAGSEGDSRAGRGRSGGAGAHRGHRGSHHSSLREMLRGAARCGLPPNLLLSDRGGCAGGKHEDYSVCVVGDGHTTWTMLLWLLLSSWTPPKCECNSVMSAVLVFLVGELDKFPVHTALWASTIYQRLVLLSCYVLLHYTPNGTSDVTCRFQCR